MLILKLMLIFIKPTFCTKMGNQLKVKNCSSSVPLIMNSKKTSKD